MQIGSDDMSWIAKITYGVCSFVGGALATAFSVGVRMNKRDALNAKRDERIAALEAACLSQHSFCDKRWEDILKLHDEGAKLIGERICAAVKQMMSDAKIESEDDLTEIKISLATLIAQQEGTKDLRDMLKSIIERRVHP